jgi:hypothetical protein
MNFSDADSIHALSALLSQAQDEDTVSAMRVPSAHMTVVAKRSAPAKPQSQSKNIWEDSEILSEEAVQSFLDDRPCPRYTATALYVVEQAHSYCRLHARYEILYKQSVGTEDVFLGTTDKTPGSADCTHLVVKIHFPNATLSALDLHITKRRVHAESATQ